MARKKKIIKYKMSKLTQNHILVCVDSSQVNGGSEINSCDFGRLFVAGENCDFALESKAFLALMIFALVRIFCWQIGQGAFPKSRSEFENGANVVAASWYLCYSVHCKRKFPTLAKIIPAKILPKPLPQGQSSRQKASGGAGCRWRTRPRRRRPERRRRAECGRTGWRKPRRRSRRRLESEREAREEGGRWRESGLLTLPSTSSPTMTGSAKHGASTSPTLMLRRFRSAELSFQDFQMTSCVLLLKDNLGKSIQYNCNGYDPSTA